MCKCTPNMRTPFCGKPGCEWPAQELERELVRYENGRVVMTGEIDRLRQEITRLGKLVYVPGLWRCPKCEFSLMRTALNVVTGTATTDDSVGQKCPNCSSSLWRVTERDAGNELARRLDAAHGDLDIARDRLARWAQMLMDRQDHASTDVRWPTSKGDPIKPVWSYGDQKGLYEAQALRMLAHDLVDRIRELELPVRVAMKRAGGEGLDALAYARMMHCRVENQSREIAKLRRKLKQPASSDLPRTSRCATDGHVWVGTGDDRVVCDGCGLDRSVQPPYVMN